MHNYYAPRRIWSAFRFLATIFATVLKRKHILFIPPLGPTALKKTVLDLGVSFIKLAQVLATRADFFTEEYLVELRTIHDEVAPMTQADLDVMYRRAFGDSPPFVRFESEPMASASIGQVHWAQLADGTEVAVKIRRLDIERKVRVDIRILEFFLGLFRPFFSVYTRNSLEAVLTEFSAMILKEVDMTIERDNLRKFREMYTRDDVHFPSYYHEYSNRDVLVMSFEHGVRVDDAAALERLHIPFNRIMDTLVDFYTEQMLVKGLFHADPHPGNLFVREDGTLVLLDFGMVKRLTNSSKMAMIEMVEAASARDFEMFIAACERLGVITPSAPPEEMLEFAEKMFDIFGNIDLDAASMQTLALDVLFSMKETPFKMPQEVVYVLRASTLIEGLGTNYVENFNGVKDILPVLREKLPKALGFDKGLVSQVRREISTLPMTFKRIKTIITDLSEQKLQVKISRHTVDQINERLRGLLRPLVSGFLCIIAAFFVLQLDVEYGRTVAVTLFGFGVLRMLLGVR
ncbi:ABC1 kinase family protein [Desulfonatronum lacustre]|uniref:ABC1 kinase family protein n=1 Tax=Desulfonatronum lacustre TaxID=66849 RepID=UPI00048A9FF8|nr:AarF/ABC1/UbiB kinase family protein [Desulfonatronum lacustre]SMP67782.1 Predicted unusual protein kinase regulating ubiquinone biosynthesis, AarF/ABC1/UbiB family [Desulfonatronum zhilinae]